MAVSLVFHPEALSEHAEAASYSLREATPRIADSFVAAVESALATLIDTPARWRVVEEPDIRRCVLSRFPFAVYYRWERPREHVTVYAVMHSSREPGYWHGRMASGA